MEELYLTSYYRFFSAQGQLGLQKLLPIEQACLEQALSISAQEQVVVLGALRSAQALFPQAKKVVQLAAEPLPQTSYIQAAYQALPLRDEHSDLVALPYLLQWLTEPKQVLEEVYRILKGQGSLVLWGLQPLHPWCWLNLPQLKPGLSYLSLRKLLSEHNFLIKRTYWLKWGAVYLIKAEKQQIPLTPLRDKWTLTALEPGLAQPSLRSANANRTS